MTLQCCCDKQKYKTKYVFESCRELFHFSRQGQTISREISETINSKSQLYTLSLVVQIWEGDEEEKNGFNNLCLSFVNQPKEVLLVKKLIILPRYYR